MLMLCDAEKLEEVGRLVDQLEQDLSEKKILSSRKLAWSSWCCAAV